MTVAAQLGLLLCVAPALAVRLSQLGPLEALPTFFETITRRKCMVDVVEDWPRLRDTWACAGARPSPCPEGATPEDRSDAADEILNEVAGIWAAEDEMKAILISAGTVGQKIVRARQALGPKFAKGLSDYAKLNEEIEVRMDGLKKVGFSYKRALLWCKKGYDATFRSCLDAALKEQAIITEDSVTDYLDRKQYNACRSRSARGFNSSAYMKVPEAKLTDTEKSVSRSPLWRKVKTKCKKEALDQSLVLFDFVKARLQVGEEVGGKCQESQDDFCPEGTYAVSKRMFRAREGAMVFAVAFPLTKAIAIGAFTAGGAITGGPGGAAAGFSIGSTIPVPTIVAFMASFYASMGPRTCGCFPLKCLLDQELGTCRIGARRGDTGKNPFRNAVPFMSTKCIEVPGKKKKKCALQQCAAEDYARALEHPELKGTVGLRPEDGGYYNCLSTNGRVTGDISASQMLTDGEDNTAAAKAQLFGQLGVPGALVPIEPEALPEDSE